MIEKYGVIYKITNEINNKCYIGQTTKKGGFDSRYHGNVEKNIHNKHLKRAFNKYGIENFIIEKEFDCGYSKEELNIKEKQYINEYKSNNPDYGYNIKTGGDNIGKIVGKNKAEILIRQGNPIFCKTTCEIFLSLVDVEEKYKIPRQTIARQCKGKSFRKKMVYNKELDTYMEFQYYNPNNKRSKNIPVRCLTTNESFSSIKNASIHLNIKFDDLNNAFKLRSKKYKQYKKVEIQNIHKMHLEFMYLYDYICKNYGKMANLNRKSSETL